MLGINAVDRLYDAVTRLRERFGSIPLTVDPALEPVVEESIAYYAPSMGEAMARELFEYPTINLGRFGGGEAINSVPQAARAEVDVRLTETTVEFFLRSRRIASHRRSMRRGGHTTLKEHMPPSHQRYAEWTPERITTWAAKTGPATAELTRQVMAARRHPQQGYRSCLGILRLGKAYGPNRLEAASRRALAIGAKTYKSIESILKNGLDGQPLPEGDAPAKAPISHDNIRGAHYYNVHTNKGKFEC